MSSGTSLELLFCIADFKFIREKNVGKNYMKLSIKCMVFQAH